MTKKLVEMNDNFEESVAKMVKLNVKLQYLG